MNVCVPIGPYLIPNANNSALSSSALTVTNISSIVQCTSTTGTNGLATYACNQQLTGGGTGILSNIYVFGDFLWGVTKGLAIYITEVTVVGVLLAAFGIPTVVILPIQILIWFLMARWIVAFISGRYFVTE